MMMLMQGSGKHGYQIYEGNEPTTYVKRWDQLVGLFRNGIINYITYEPHPVNEDTDTPWKADESLSIASNEIGTSPVRAFLALPNSEAFCLVNLQRLNGPPTYFWINWFPKESHPENVRTMKYGIGKFRPPCCMQTRHWKSKVCTEQHFGRKLPDDFSFPVSDEFAELSAFELRILLFHTFFWQPELKLIFCSHSHGSNLFRLPKDVFYLLVHKIIFQGMFPSWAVLPRFEQSEYKWVWDAPAPKNSPEK